MAELAFEEAPQDEAPAHRLPLTSRWVPFWNVIVAPGLIISFAPGATVTSPVTVCSPAQVSVPVIVPAAVSFDAMAVPAGSDNESKMLNKNNPAREMDLTLPSPAIILRVPWRQFNHRVSLVLRGIADRAIMHGI